MKTNLQKKFHRHARRRARQRLGFRLKNKDIATLSKMVQNYFRDTSVLTERKRVVFSLNYRGKDFKVVYDTRQKTIVTVLNV